MNSVPPVVPTAGRVMTPVPLHDAQVLHRARRQRQRAVDLHVVEVDGRAVGVGDIAADGSGRRGRRSELQRHARVDEDRRRIGSLDREVVHVIGIGRALGLGRGLGLLCRRQREGAVGGEDQRAGAGAARAGAACRLPEITPSYCVLPAGTSTQESPASATLWLARIGAVMSRAHATARRCRPPAHRTRIGRGAARAASRRAARRPRPALGARIPPRPPVPAAGRRRASRAAGEREREHSTDNDERPE